jgi:uroporphyrinogen-III synthase
MTEQAVRVWPAAPRPREDPDVLPLQGWEVAVTGARRGRDLVALFEQRGARVWHVPAVQTVPLDSDHVQRAVTTQALAGPPDVVVATTGAGFAAWLEAADGWGLGEQLHRALADALVYARGPKARGALLAAGLQDAAAVPCDSTWALLEHLLTTDLAGQRLVVQLHGAAIDDFTRTLRTAGADVLEVPVYRTVPPDDDTELQRLVLRLAAREVHAITFTSAAAATNLLDVAARMGAYDALLAALRTMLVGCVGPVAAAPLERVDVPVVLPGQPRLGALAHVLTEHLQRRAVRLSVAGHDLEVRGQGAVVDGMLRPLAPAPMAILRALCRHAGRVVSTAELTTCLPGGGDSHAVEMAVSRLRAGLGDPACVRNVVKRGYRLSADAQVEEPWVPTTEDDPPLLRSLGGASGVRAAVELLYERLLADPEVAHFFTDIDMPRLKRHQVLMLCQLLGGRALYVGRELAEAHAGLGITSAQYRAVVTHLADVLVRLGADEPSVQDVRSALDDLAADVIGP